MTGDESLISAEATDPYRLCRFREAQDTGNTYHLAVAELRAGRKASHWMWVVFPQIAGLGRSAMARTYAISSLHEARAFLVDPILGFRLVESASILTELSGRAAHEIFGQNDAVKLRSSMTLFACAAPGEPVFQRVLDQYFGGVADDATRRLPRPLLPGRP